MAQCIRIGCVGKMPEGRRQELGEQVQEEEVAWLRKG